MTKLKAMIVANAKQKKLLEALDGSLLSLTLTKMHYKTDIPISTIFDQWNRFLNNNDVQLIISINGVEMRLGRMKR